MYSYSNTPSLGFHWNHTHRHGTCHSNLVCMYNAEMSILFLACCKDFAHTYPSILFYGIAWLKTENYGNICIKFGHKVAIIVKNSLIDLPILLHVPRPFTNCILPMHDKPSSQNGPIVLLQKSPSLDLTSDLLYKCWPKHGFTKTDKKWFL